MVQVKHENIGVDQTGCLLLVSVLWKDQTVANVNTTIKVLELKDQSLLKQGPFSLDTIMDDTKFSEVSNFDFSNIHGNWDVTGGAYVPEGHYLIIPQGMDDGLVGRFLVRILSEGNLGTNGAQPIGVTVNQFKTTFRPGGVFVGTGSESVICNFYYTFGHLGNNMGIRHRWAR